VLFGRAIRELLNHEGVFFDVQLFAKIVLSSAGIDLISSLLKKRAASL
jgi:hypothetical protein